MRLLRHLALALLLCLGMAAGWARHAESNTPGGIDLADLPAEARQTLRLIEQGGPFPYPRDGIVFGNYERRLPGRPRGYYREYTVPTPGLRGRGARRLIAGDRGERYYTGDHYLTFQRVRE